MFGINKNRKDNTEDGTNRVFKLGDILGSNRSSLDPFEISEEEFKSIVLDNYKGKGDLSEVTNIPVQHLIKSLVDELGILQGYIKALNSKGFGQGDRGDNGALSRLTEESREEIVAIFSKMQISAGRLSLVFELLEKYSKVSVSPKIKELLASLMNK